MTTRNPRIVGTLVGDITHEPGARTKYRHFFEALERCFTLVDVYDATLRSVDRLINALLVFHPNRTRWRERFYKNVPAFRRRSQRVVSHLRSVQGQADVVLQVGTLFNACWGDAPLPGIVYTDYTAHLSAQKLAAGRSPFTPRQRQQWIALERQAFQQAVHVCTRSELVRTSILTDYGIPAHKVTTIGGGVNLAALPQSIVKTDNSPPTALFIGKDFYRKGGDLLLRAFAQARARCPNACLLLVTGGPIPADLPLAGVELITPTWDRKAIAALYRRADLFVLPSRLETWGDVLLEAMAYGLPCIGVASDAMDEIIEHRKTGLIVPPENIEALTAALVQMLGDASLRQQWGYAGRQRLEAKYTWDGVVQQLAPVIQMAADLAYSKNL